MPPIPRHALHAPDTREFALFRWEAIREQLPTFDALGQHRDAHYLFFVLAAGTASLLVDFTEVPLQAPTLYYLLPEQVHEPVRSDVTRGWVLAVAPHVVPAEHQQALAATLALPQPIALTEAQVPPLLGLLELLAGQSKSNAASSFHASVLHHLVLTFLSAVAAHVPVTPPAPGTRAVLLAHQFQVLLRAQFRQVKRPAAYAAQLAISPAYLAEVVKKTTGLAVGYWITQQVLLEAKRLLCYTDLDIKQIAQEVGLTDSAYFAKLFKQQCCLTPTAFRVKYRR
jgi:AraC family transcriptional activator of pobA